MGSIPSTLKPTLPPTILSIPSIGFIHSIPSYEVEMAVETFQFPLLGSLKVAGVKVEGGVSFNSLYWVLNIRIE